MNRKHRSEDRGMALVIAVSYASVLGLMAAAFIGLLHQTHAQLVRNEWNQQALHLAEAGVAQAIANLRMDPAYSGENGIEIGEDRVDIRVDAVEPGRTYAVYAVGALRNGDVVYRRRACRVALVIAPDGAVRIAGWSEEKP